MRNILLIAAFLCYTILIMAQESRPYVWVKTKSGFLYEGVLIEASSDYYVINVRGAGDLTLYKINVDWVSFTDSTYDSVRENHLENSGASNYYIIPSAYNLHKGQIRYSNVLVFANFVEYGISDNLSISAGLELFSVISGESSSPGFGLWLKYSVPIIENKLHGSLGTLFGFADDNGLTGGMIWYGMFTYGSERNNISLGPGYATNFNSLSRPVYVFSFKTHVSKKLALMSSNFLIPIDDRLAAAFTPGFRINIPGSTHLDLGGLIYMDEFGDVYGAPILGISIIPLKFKKASIRTN